MCRLPPRPTRSRWSLLEDGGSADNYAEDGADDPSPWARSNTEWEVDETDKAMQVAKNRGVVAYGREVFGTVRASVNVNVPLNWSNDEVKWTCIGRLLQDGPDDVLSVTWSEVTAR